MGHDYLKGEKWLKNPHRILKYKVEMYFTLMEHVTVEIQADEDDDDLCMGDKRIKVEKAAKAQLMTRAQSALDGVTFLGGNPEVSEVSITSGIETFRYEPTLEDYVNDDIIDDAADRDPRLAELRALAIEAGWVKIWLTPDSATGEGPSIVHWPTFAGDANENDSTYSNWEWLAWECGLVDTPEPVEQRNRSHLKRKEK